MNGQGIGDKSLHERLSPPARLIRRVIHPALAQQRADVGPRLLEKDRQVRHSENRLIHDDLTMADLRHVTLETDAIAALTAEM